MEKFKFFWGGVFSQWYPSLFIIDGVEYKTAEQYMMVKKALMFNDFDTAKKIMATANPQKQKILGREVKNFNAELWNTYCRKIVFDANYAKFTQNPDLYNELMATKNLTLVEASPSDKIWGIGLGENDERALDRTKWLGTNWLGIAIQEVRNELEKYSIH